MRPLTRGMGHRTARIELRGESRPGTTTWRVREARIQRPAQSVPDEATEVVAEYRQMHQRIVVQWREGVQDTAVMAAGFTAEQVALWFLGGAVFRILGTGMRVAAPALMRFTRAGGGRAGVQYLETMLVRLGPEGRAELRTLMARAETAGESALTVAERSRLQAIWARLESLVAAPLTKVEKKYVRDAMVARYEAAHSTAAAALRAAAGQEFQIHHRLPLEYGHLVPGFDLNAGSNLIGLDVLVHRGVNGVWTRFRTAPTSRITTDIMRQVAAIVDRHFGRWYNLPPNQTGLVAAVEAAQGAACREVDLLLRTL